jgi:AbrB family looped-hinge helix DNA binding protein
MVIVENEAKKWGNSFGIIIPKDIAKKMNIKEGEKLKIDIITNKKIDGFGMFKKAKPFKEEKDTHEEFW